MAIERTTISDPPRRVRLLSRGIDLKAAGKPVEREGGDAGAGLIRSFSVTSAGEALGHRIWLDQEFLRQTAAAGNGREGGIKARFTHPGLSGDGLGTLLGRARNFRHVKTRDQVFADLHFAASAHGTPNGDLAKYVMDMAEETPEEFGASIVFDPDRGAEQEFVGKNSDEEGTFKSPDKANARNFPHARLARLYASDVVDEPAANPAGLFSAEGFAEGSELAARGEAILAYALGLSDDAPDELGWGPHPERARAFVQGFLERRNLSLRNVEGRDGDDILLMRELAAELKLMNGIYSAHSERLAKLERALDCLKARFELTAS